MQNYISGFTAEILQPETDSDCCGHRAQQTLFLFRRLSQILVIEEYKMFEVTNDYVI